MINYSPLSTTCGITVGGTGLSTITGQLYVGSTTDYFGSSTVVQLISGASNKNVGIRSNILYLYSYNNGSEAKLIFGDGAANFGLFSNDTEFALYNYGTASNSITVNRTTNAATFAGNISAVSGTFSAFVYAEDEIHLTDGGTTRAKLLLNSSDRDNVELRAESLGSTMKFFTVGTEALELDASQNATFAGAVSLTGGALSISGDGSNAATLTESGSGDFTIDAPDDIRLDAGGGDVVLKAGGTEYGRLSNSSADFVIQNTTSDKDIIFKGVDDTTTITALTLDMSDAGKATFNNGWSSDGQATEYTWRIPNTSSNDGHWYKIARVTSLQSTRFKLQMVGGHSYSDGYYSSEVNAYGQLNNDNNYDLIFYRLEKEAQSGNPIISFGQVDVDSGNPSSTDLYVRLNTFAELVITASISNGDLYPDDTSTGSSTTPTNFVAALEQFGVLSPTKFQGTVRFNSQILDKDNNAGTSGQLLSSTGSQVDWVDASAVIGGPYLPLAGGTLTGALTGTSATFAGDVTIGSSGAASDKTLNILTGGTKSSVKLMEAGTVYGFSTVYDGATNKFHINRHNNSAAGTPVLSLNRDNDNATFAGDVISTDGTDTATLSETGLTLSRSNSYIQSNADNSDTLNIGQSSVRWGNVKVDGATFKVLNGGNERFGIDSTGNATFAGVINLSSNKSVAWPGGSIRAEGNTLKLVATTLIDLQNNTQIQGSLSITGDGSNAATLTESGSGNFTIDSVGDITLDADGSDILLSDGGTVFGKFASDSNNLNIFSQQQDKDIVFRGNDGGSGIVALTLDMSDGGYATFNSGITATNTSFSGTMNIAGGIYHIGDTNTFFGFDEGNDTFRVVTGGGERLGINNSGVRIGGGARVTTILDEDNMASNSATALATQQSIKAYVDNSISGGANYLGVWDPDDSLNNGYGNPSLQASGRTDDSGDYFICSADGAAHPNGGTTEPDSWHVGDWVIWNEDLGSSGLWQKIDNTTVLSGGGTANKVAKFTDSETIGDGPITFSSNDSTFAGTISSGAINSTGGVRAEDMFTIYDGAKVLQLKNVDNEFSIRNGNSGLVPLTIESGGNATFVGKISVGGGDTSTAQMALKGQQSLLSFIRGTSGDAQFFMSSDSARLYFSHTDIQSTNLILTLNSDESATFAGNVGIGVAPTSESNLSLGAKSTSEGGHLILNKGTSQTYATHIDNYSNSFRIMGGTDTASGSVNFSINHSNSAATFAGVVDVRGSGSGYNAIRLVNNTTANSNKQTGITTLNYVGNNVSIMQYATNASANTVYYGSADSAHSGISNHRFYVNADPNTPSSGHTQALHIASNTNATFAGSIDTTAVNIKVGSATHGTITSSSNSLTLNARNTGKLIFQSGGVEKMRINGTNVGIGEDSPNARLEVTGDIEDNWAGRFENTNTGGYGILAKVAGTSADERIFEARVGSSTKMLISGDGKTTFGGDVTFSGDILTNTDSSSDIGKTGTRWENIWVDNINGAAPVVGSNYLPLAGGTMTGTLKLNDNVELFLGTQTDFVLAHNGSNSYVSNYTGDLYIEQAKDDGNIYFKCDDGLGNVTEYFRVDGGESNTIFSRDLKFLDSGLASRKAIFGTGSDLQIYHDASNSYIKNNGGDLYIQQNTNDGDIIFQSDNGSGGSENYIQIDGSEGRTTFNKNIRLNDNVQLQIGSSNDAYITHNGTNTYFVNGVGNLEITNDTNDGDMLLKCDDGSGGVTPYLTLDGSLTQMWADKDLQFSDNIKAKFGAASDLQIYHNSSNNISFITNSNAGGLRLQSNELRIFAENGSTIRADFNTAIKLYYNDSKKFETSSAGVAVTGSLSTTEDISVVGDVMISGTTTAGGTLICEGNITVQDSDKLQLGNSQDLELYHASGVSYIDNDTGHLYIRNNVDNDDGSNIYIQAKSGENSILCQDDGAVGLYNNNVQKFSTNSTGVGAYGYIGFGSAGTSTGTSYGFRYGSSSPSGSQGIVISVSDTGGAYFDGVGRFQNTNTGQGAGMFQMVNYGALYGRYMQFFRGSTSNIIGYIGYNSSNTSVTFSTTNSDIRTKKNITTWDENVLDKFKALQPKRFDFKVAIGDKGAVKERGFIAQYEKDNFPEAYQLNGNDEKATYGFHPMEMVPYMMKAIKDLTIKNEELEKRIKTLEP